MPFKMYILINHRRIARAYAQLKRIIRPIIRRAIVGAEGFNLTIMNYSTGFSNLCTQ